MQSIRSRTDHPLYSEYRPRGWILARARARASLGLPCGLGQVGEAVMAGATRNDGPDVNDNVVVDHVVCVVPVHGARRVPGHQRDRVADPQGRSLGGREDAVLLVEAEDL